MFKIKWSKSLVIFALIFGLWAAYISRWFYPLATVGQAAVGMVASLFGYILLYWCLSRIRRTLKGLNRILDNTAIEIILGGTLGLLVGIMVGVLSSLPLSMIKGAGTYLTIVVFLSSGYIGLKIGSRRAQDVFRLLPLPAADRENVSGLTMKVLDTSAIIDGRIYDVCLSNFLEGSLIAPTFVIEELQHIADSSDTIRRNKGRRGLELLAKMQKHSNIKIDIIETDIAEEKDVDGKLIRLCKDLQASIITNDYNLNKVAELQGIKVLNINELTNAVKVIVYPGETMHISIIKEGKEPGQGVGYLEDGTMVVVEDAQDEISNDLEVMVTSVFQTAAGRMIFTRKIKEETRENATVSTPVQDVHEVNLFG